MDKQSKPYLSGEFNDIFEASDMSDLVAEELVAYSDSYYKMLVLQDATHDVVLRLMSNNPKSDI